MIQVKIKLNIVIKYKKLQNYNNITDLKALSAIIKSACLHVWFIIYYYGHGIQNISDIVKGMIKIV
jgi:hypothetical protein